MSLDQLVAAGWSGREQYRKVPVEITDRALADGERLRIWIRTHRQRKEWNAREKEMVAYRPVDLVGRARAANILGISLHELDKLGDVYERSARFTGLRDPGAAITLAPGLDGPSQKMLSPTIVDAVVEKVRAKRVTNSRDLRKILPEPVAREHFLSQEGHLDSAILRHAPSEKKDNKGGLAGDLRTVIEAKQRVPWTVLGDLQVDPELVEAIDEAEALLQSPRKALSKWRLVPTRCHPPATPRQCPQRATPPVPLHANVDLLGHEFTVQVNHCWMSGCAN